MFVVLDSNVWLSELGLNSGAGAAVRFFLRQQEAKLVVPEVVRLEAERHSRDLLTKFAEDIRNGHRQLLAIFGKLKEVVLPDEEAITKRVSTIFSDIGVELIDVPFSVESARSSFLKTISKVPPSDKDQQFKDGVIWADCCGLLKEDDVVLVTGDKAFYHDRRYDEGLAKNLIAESEAAPHHITLLQSLGHLLTKIKAEVVLDESQLVSSFLTSHREGVDRMLDRTRFRMTEDFHLTKSLFATEDPERVYVQFEIKLPCEDMTPDARTNAVLHLKGDGTLIVKPKDYADVHIRGQQLSFENADGTMGDTTNHFLAVGPCVIGHRDVVHSVRYSLD